MSTYSCKYCGVDYSSLRGLTSGSCNKNPAGKYHIPYEGSVQKRYSCKYCGVDYSSLRGLTSGSCHKNPAGKYHEPLRGQ